MSGGVALLVNCSVMHAQCDKPRLDVPSSGPKQSMPEVHGLVGSSALESTGALLSAPTQPILEVFTKHLVRTFV